jgi:hypothetical protein
MVRFLGGRVATGFIALVLTVGAFLVLATLLSAPEASAAITYANWFGQC